MEGSEPAVPIPYGESLSSRLIRDRTAGVPDGPVRPLSLYGLEFSLATASLDSLELVVRSVTTARIAEWFHRFPATEEVALLSTCHRVELALLVRFPEELDRWREVLPGSRGSWTLREGRELVHHLFRVAAGRESLAVGEAEVRQQVRAAASSVESRHPRPVLRELLVGAAEAADAAYPSFRSPRSIASIAAARLLELSAQTPPRVLVVGSGTVGRQIVEGLAPHARVTVVYHQRPPDELFLRATRARAVRLDRLAEEIRGSDAVVTAAKFGNHGLRAPDLPRDRPLLLVDLGVPRNIDPDVRRLPNVRLVDLEELHGLSAGFRVSDRYDAHVEERAALFSSRLERLLLEPWIETLRRAAEEVRCSEVATARPFLGNLDPHQEVAIERLTRRLVQRLLIAPTERIRSLPSGPEGDLPRRFAVDLLRPHSSDP